MMFMTRRSRRAIDLVSGAILILVIVAVAVGGLLVYQRVRPKGAPPAPSNPLQINVLTLTNNGTAELFLKVTNVGAKIINGLNVTLGLEPPAPVPLPGGAIEQNQTAQYVNDDLNASQYTVGYLYIVAFEMHCTDGSTASMLASVNCTSP
jgi:hypothetical protein